MRGTVSRAFSGSSPYPYQINFQGCFVRKGFTKELLITKYLWIWISSFLMTVLYCIMFATMRGWFIIDNGIYWYKTYGRKYGTVQPVEETQDEKYSKAIANLML